MDIRLFNKIFLSGLYNKKFDINEIPEKFYNEILSISDRSLMSAYLLKILDFKNNENDLIKNLNLQLRICILKKLQIQSDLIKLSIAFKKNNINYCYLKGTAINFISDDSRFARDIDVLIEKKFISDAYNILKSIGFNYFDKLVSDDTKYMNSQHQLPVMKNKNGTLVEVHHRVTKKNHFYTCPLSANMLKSKKIATHNSNEINIPRTEYIIAHVIYHAFKHNNLSFGPSFLYDLKSLKSIETIDSDLVLELLSKLNLEKQYLNTLNVLNNDHVTDLNKSIYINTTNEILRKKTPKPIAYYFTSKHGLKDLMKGIAFKISSTEDRYQVSKFSFKYYYILCILFLRSFKKRL